MAYQRGQQMELIALAEAAGIYAIPGVFRVIIELLALQVSPEDIHTLLRQICPIPQKKKIESSKHKSVKAEA